MRFQKPLHRPEIDLPLCIFDAQDPLELAFDGVAREELDLPDQPVQPEPDGGVADTVNLRDLFERARRQNETSDKCEVFLR